MTTAIVPDPDGVALNKADALVLLRDAGDHPLMYSFPQGAVFVFDRDLRYLSAGGHGLADVGLSREMLEGRTIFEVFPPETAAVIEPHYRAALDGSSTTWDIPYRGRVYAQRLAPVTDPSGRIVAGLGFTQDVTAARIAERGLKESEERNRLTFMHAPIGQAIVELDGRWRQVNAAVTRLTGYPEEQLLRLTFQDITHPDDLEIDLGLLSQLVAGEVASYEMEKRYITASAQIVWVLLSVALVRDEDGSPLYFIAQIQDITEAKRQQQAMHDLTSSLAQLNRDVGALSDLSNRLQRCVTTQEAIEVTARGVSAILSGVSGALYVRADPPASFVRHTAWGPHAPAEPVLHSTGCHDPHDQPATETDPAGLVAGAHRLGAKGAPGRWCVPLTASGQLYGMLRFGDDDRAVLADHTEGEGVSGLATAAAEVAALALANLDLREQLWTQAMRDPLTGLYNRRFLEEWAVGELSRTDRASESLGVIVVDLDHFKQVNDAHGHEAGDHVLKAVASILRSALRPADIACRFGGEEFLLLLSFIDGDTLTARAEDIRCRVESAREQHAGVWLPPITVSIGVALYPEHGDSLTGTVAAADAALYRAKQAGRNCVEYAAV